GRHRSLASKASSVNGLVRRALAGLAEDEEPNRPCREARGRRRVGKGALAMSVAPLSSHNRIMIYGPKPDSTYVIEFKIADGEALAISAMPARHVAACSIAR